MNNQINRHPSLVYYGSKTLNHDFPLVLFVGREPQVDEEMISRIGSYDFTEHPRCAFWNVAYCQVAKADGRPEFGTAALKRECRQVDASPITFADVLPICLSNKNSSSVKLRERSAIASTLIDEHINGILSLDLFARVSLVVLSGHERSEFTYATEVFQSRLDAKGVPHITTAFLYPTNSSKIRSVIEETGTIGRFQSILRKFRNAF